MKHTPGEWFSGATGSVLSGTFEVHLGMDNKDSNGEYKRVCTGKTNDFYEAQANANLIASAPEMLELLTKLRYQIEGQLLSTEIKQIDSIIAKVEGK